MAHPHRLSNSAAADRSLGGDPGQMVLDELWVIPGQGCGRGDLPPQGVGVETVVIDPQQSDFHIRHAGRKEAVPGGLGGVVWPEAGFVEMLPGSPWLPC